MSDNTLSSLITAIQDIEDKTSMSLTQYTRDVAINSNTYISDGLMNNPIVGPLVENIINLYAGFVLTALSMNTYVTDTKRVRDLVKTVATESLTSKPLSTTCTDYFGSLESFWNMAGTFKSLDTNDEEMRESTTTMGSSFLEAKGPTNLIPGRVIQVTMGIGDKKINVDLMIQLHPTYVAPEVMSQFVELNHPPSFGQRWLQAKAGEISTFSDLILGLDIRRKRLKALKKDTDGVLSNMLDRQSNSALDYFLKLAQLVPNKQNIANSILIYDKSQFDMAASRSGMRVDNFDSRQKFMAKSFTMLLAVVDDRYGSVDIYYHGLRKKSTFTNDQIIKHAKVDANDLVNVMKNYASNMAPKF